MLLRNPNCLTKIALHTNRTVNTIKLDRGRYFLCFFSFHFLFLFGCCKPLNELATWHAPLRICASSIRYVSLENVVEYFTCFAKFSLLGQTQIHPFLYTGVTKNISNAMSS